MNPEERCQCKGNTKNDILHTEVLLEEEQARCVNNSVMDSVGNVNVLTTLVVQLDSSHEYRKLMNG